MYRTILRGTKNIKDTKTREESRKYARDEFERHRGVTDLVRLPLQPIYCFCHGLLLTGRTVTHQISSINREDRVGGHGEVCWQHVRCIIKKRFMYILYNSERVSGNGTNIRSMLFFLQSRIGCRKGSRRTHVLICKALPPFRPYRTAVGRT